MRVLHFLDSIGGGGAEVQALDVCRNASKLGLEMTIVTAKGGSLESDFRATGVDFHKLGRRFPLDPFLVTRIRKIVRERKIEIVHGYQAVDGLHLYLATLGLSHVKKVLSFQGPIPGRKNRLATKSAIPLMDANIAVSKSIYSYLSEIIGLHDFSSFELIYNGADPERIKPVGTSIRTELNLDQNARLGGMIANFRPDLAKDHFTVCRALTRVVADHPDLHFLFAGSISAGGEDRAAKCVRYCEENDLIKNVHFLGARNDIPDILRELDVFVHSSLLEGLPVAVCEAMLAGVPSILSDIEPHLEISENGKYSELFPTGNAEILAEKINFLLANEQCSEALAIKARVHAENNFSISAHLTALLKLYRSLIDQ